MPTFLVQDAHNQIKFYNTKCFLTNEKECMSYVLCKETSYNSVILFVWSS